MSHVTNRSRGFMLLEALAAGVLLAVLLGIVLRAMTLVSLERRRVDQRAIALQEAASAMARATAVPYVQLTPQRLSQIELTPSLDTLLAGATLTWSVEEEPRPAKHIRLELAWRDLGRVQPAEIELHYWAYPPQPGPAEESP